MADETRIPLIDVIEMAGQMAEVVDPSLSCRAMEPYARMVMEHSGRLTLLGAMSLVAHWRTARDDYTSALGVREDGD